MDITDKQTPERRADQEVRQAIDSIQNRFLSRVADQIAQGLSLRELDEELIFESLAIANASYGCTFRLNENDELVLSASVAICEDGCTQRLRDSLPNGAPDDVMQDVIDALKPTFSNNASDSLLANLPAMHPAIRNFAICPLNDQGTLRAVLLIANAKSGFDLVLVKRLQSMLDTFIRVNINSIINRGIKHVITGIGDINVHLMNVREASFNAVLTVDENLTITAFNLASERLFQVATADALGNSLDLFLESDVLDLSLIHI